MGMARALVEHHQGEVPNTMEALVELPGVGRKTANVVLGHALGVPGLPVDRHVLRVSNRIGIASIRRSRRGRAAARVARCLPPSGPRLPTRSSCTAAASASRSRCATSASFATIATSIARSPQGRRPGNRDARPDAGHDRRIVAARTRKRFGQHFLEPVWADKVVDAIAPAPTMCFSRSGPGRAF